MLMRGDTCVLQRPGSMFGAQQEASPRPAVPERLCTHAHCTPEPERATPPRPLRPRPSRRIVISINTLGLQAWTLIVNLKDTPQGLKIDVEQVRLGGGEMWGG